MDGAVQAPFKELALEATWVSRNATFYVWSPLCLWITHPATLAQKGWRWGAARIPGVPPGSLDKLPSGLGPGLLIWDILYFALPASDADANFCCHCLGEMSRSTSALGFLGPRALNSTLDS